MRDPRVEGLARVLTEYSLELEKGDVCLIQGGVAAEPLMQALYEAVLDAGAHPIVDMAMEGAQAAFFARASDEQLEWVAPPIQWAMENADSRIRILSDTNTRELSAVAPERQQRRQKAMHPLMQTMMERSASGELRWNVTLFPTNAYASAASMSLTDYEDFYYRACLTDQADPVAAWRAAAKETNRLADWIQGKEEVVIEGPGTNLKLNVADRYFKPADGKYNMPDGEFFTGPVEDSAEGEVTFHLPATYSGREVAGVRFRFEGGKVVDASAERGEDFLISVLDTDEGARRLGELGIGTNFGITDGTGEILLDEKIGGTIHLAVGASYPETGGVNESAVHWDMICDLRRGGSVTVDGEKLQQDGKFVV
ncbi:MAG: aminopeptidase [Solirubrobacterales bacterium]|nr:aminopeptidase [Solirubrobacterales bacterium]